MFKFEVEKPVAREFGGFLALVPDKRTVEEKEVLTYSGAREYNKMVDLRLKLLNDSSDYAKENDDYNQKKEDIRKVFVPLADEINKKLKDEKDESEIALLKEKLVELDKEFAEKVTTDLKTEIEAVEAKAKEKVTVEFSDEFHELVARIFDLWALNEFEIQTNNGPQKITMARNSVYLVGKALEPKEDVVEGEVLK